MSCKICGRHSIICGGCGYCLHHCTCMPKSLSANHLQDLLALISLDVPKSVIVRWSMEVRHLVADYAAKVHLRASDNIVRVPKKPEALNNPKIKHIGFTPIKEDG